DGRGRPRGCRGRPRFWLVDGAAAAEAREGGRQRGSGEDPFIGRAGRRTDPARGGARGEGGGVQGEGGVGTGGGEAPRGGRARGTAPGGAAHRARSEVRCPAGEGAAPGGARQGAGRARRGGAPGGRGIFPARGRGAAAAR